MLVGEPFGDHPPSVCPVIGAFLRRYNDTVNDEHRNALYRYAALVVGTAASDDVRRARLHRLHTWTQEHRQRRRRRGLLPERWRALAFPEVADGELLADRAAHEVVRHGRYVHAEVLSLLDELIGIGAPSPEPAPPSTVDSLEQQTHPKVGATAAPSTQGPG